MHKSWIFKIPCLCATFKQHYSDHILLYFFIEKNKDAIIVLLKSQWDLQKLGGGGGKEYTGRISHLHTLSAVAQLLGYKYPTHLEATNITKQLYGLELQEYTLNWMPK